jgi:hypothetical protein
MEQEHVDHWSRLMDQALVAVRRGAALHERGTRRLFQVIVIPAFEVAASWELFEVRPRSDEKFFDVILTAWDQRTDSSKFENPLERLKDPLKLEPSIRSRRVRISATDATAMTAAFEGVHIPVVAGEHPYGADGTSYRLASGDLFGGSTFEWWESGPANWAPLVETMRQVLTVLERLVSATLA